MTKYLVSVNGAPATETHVQPRTSKLVPGVLCEVAINGRLQLCLVDRIGTLVIDVRRLPDATEDRRPRALSPASTPRSTDHGPDPAGPESARTR